MNADHHDKNNNGMKTIFPGNHGNKNIIRILFKKRLEFRS
jgi:hypothetical protein